MNLLQCSRLRISAGCISEEEEKSKRKQPKTVPHKSILAHSDRMRAGSRATTSVSLRSSCRWLTVEFLRLVDHPLGKYRSILRRLAAGNCPVVQPPSSRANVVVGNAVRTIAEGIFERDELVAPLSKQVDKLADVIGFEPVSMEQQNLLGFIAEQI